MGFGLAVMVTVAVSRRSSRPSEDHFKRLDRDRIAASGSGGDFESSPNRLRTRPSHEFVALDGVLSSNLNAEIASIQGESDPVALREKLERLSADVSEDEFSSVVAALLSNPSSAGDAGLGLIRAWADDNEGLVAHWIEVLARAWGDQNLPQAPALIQELKDQAERLARLPATAYEIAQTQPEEAIRLAMGLPNGSAREALIAHSALEWAANDPQAAAKWAEGTKPGAAREKALRAVATALGDTDPIAAATLALNSMKAGRPMEDALVSIVQRWAQKDPANAAAWVAQFPDGSLRDAAVDNLVGRWVDRDGIEAAKWVSGLPAGAGQDQALSTFASKIALTHPETALLWAGRIGDDGMRQRQMENVGANWLKRDAAVARAWIENANLPDSVKTRLLAQQH